MKIYSMTATFGKLEHQTLTLEPGLNVIHAPNEWGKSTWCAFIVAMLYGIDTRERNTLTTLADKERYKPWSGAPMSGRMDIHWNGKDITLERSTKGRAIMGQFAAYETATGLPVSELTAENCGQMLLGVEKSVFTRAGFVRLTDMPVTNDESLRRRLNALVTTGDESGASDALAQKLKDLKNNVRHNKTGALPQAETQRKQIEEDLQKHQQLQQKRQSIRQRQEYLQTQIKNLENHQVALNYEAAAENMRRIEAANTARDAALQVMQTAQIHCQTLPGKETAQRTLQQLNDLQQQWNNLQAEPQPVAPEPVQTPTPFTGMTGDQAVQQAKSDYDALQMLTKPLSPALLILAGLFAVASIGFAFIQWYLLFPFAVLAAVFFMAHQRSKAAQSRDRQAVTARYGTIDAQLWVPMAEKYREDAAAFAQKNSAYQQAVSLMQSRREALTRQSAVLTQGQPLAACISSWEGILSHHDALQEKKRDYQQKADHAAALAAMAKPAQAPAFADTLTLSAAQTQQALLEAATENRQLDQSLGQCEGQMQTLGQEDVLRRQLEALQRRIEKLEDIYAALTIAQQTLADAADSLQRRFAPKITQNAQALFAQFTQGRYDRLMLGQDLSVSAGAQGEDTLHSGMWRSDGTVDQLYLALRLAVARELTPEAPLVLDDALVRFDDTRLGLAMDILAQEANEKQVILFTCQTREEVYLSGK